MTLDEKVDNDIIGHRQTCRQTDNTENWKKGKEKYILPWTNAKLCPVWVVDFEQWIELVPFECNVRVEFDCNIL